MNVKYLALVMTIALVLAATGCGKPKWVLNLPPSSCVTMNTTLRYSTCSDDQATCDKLLDCCSKPGTGDDQGCMMFYSN